MASTLLLPARNVFRGEHSSWCGFPYFSAEDCSDSGMEGNEDQAVGEERSLLEISTFGQLILWPPMQVLQVDRAVFDEDTRQEQQK